MMLSAVLSKKDSKPVADKKRRLITFGQFMGCVGGGACGAALGLACITEGTITAETGCVAAAGVLAVFGCKDAVDSCVGKKRRVMSKEPTKVVSPNAKSQKNPPNPKNKAPKRKLGKKSLKNGKKAGAKGLKRRMVSFGQIMGCLGSGVCGVAVAAACVTEGVVTAGAGCLAAGGALAVIGCTDAVKSCVGKRRAMIKEPTRKLSTSLNMHKNPSMVRKSRDATSITPTTNVSTSLNMHKNPSIARKSRDATSKGLRRMVTFSQIMGCVGSGVCGVAVAAACATEGVVTVGAGCLAAGGALATFGCTEVVKSCVGKRRAMIKEPTRRLYASLKKQKNPPIPKNKKNKTPVKGLRRMVTFGQIMGCVGSGVCGVAVAAACATEGVVTVGAGCLAAGGALAVIGCTDAVKSCVGKRRALLERNVKN